MRRQGSSRFWLVQIDSESASILPEFWSNFWKTAWMMRIFYWRLMKKELWFLMDRKIGYSEWSGLIKDVTDASDWSKRFNFYISGLLPIFSEFSRFSWFSELKKTPSAEDLWLGDFLQAPAISIKIRVNYCQLIKKRDLSSNSWYFFISYYRFYDRKSSKSSKTLFFA